MSYKIYEEILFHLMIDSKPSTYLEAIKENLKGTALNDLYELSFIDQEKKYHPEGVVWNHVMMVVDIAAKIKENARNKEEFMLAALFHDIGKKATTVRNKNGRLISYNHDKVGAEEVRKILTKCGVEIKKVEKVVNLVQFHMHHLYIIKNLPFGNVDKMLKEVDLQDMILLFLCDRLGRGTDINIYNNSEINDIKAIVKTLENNYGVNTSKINNILNEYIKN